MSIDKKVSVLINDIKRSWFNQIQEEKNAQLINKLKIERHHYHPSVQLPGVMPCANGQWYHLILFIRFSYLCVSILNVVDSVWHFMTTRTKFHFRKWTQMDATKKKWQNLKRTRQIQAIWLFSHYLFVFSRTKKEPLLCGGKLSSVATIRSFKVLFLFFVFTPKLKCACVCDDFVTMKMEIWE